MDNIQSNKITSYDKDLSQRQLVSHLHLETYLICHKDIPDEYIKQAFIKFKEGRVYYRDEKLIGFCIWRITEHLRISGSFKELYIYLICGNPLNYSLILRILDDVIHFCKKYNIHYIRLESIDNTFKSYFLEYGFIEKIGISNIKILELDIRKLKDTNINTILE